jgi:opacity protein-like surface antigen
MSYPPVRLTVAAAALAILLAGCASAHHATPPPGPPAGGTWYQAGELFATTGTMGSTYTAASAAAWCERQSALSANLSDGVAPSPRYPASVTAWLNGCVAGVLTP